jgi:CBS domain-containing protein
METSQTTVESQAIELATEAFKTFCEDISGMFGMDVQCEQQQVCAETVAGLKKRFKKLVAVHVVDSQGLLDGTFQFVFDREGLFTLGGVIAMQPEQRILTNRKDASPQLAATMVDAVGQAGNLLVASWDKVFREGLPGHGHFQQRLPAFVGKPWDQPQEKIGLAGDEELIYIPYEMTIGSYPAFNYAVIFPKTVFGENSDAVPQEAAPTEENAQDTQTAPEKAICEKSDTAEESDREKSEPQQRAADEAPTEKTDVEEAAQGIQTEEAAGTEVRSEQADEVQTDGGEEPEPEQSDAVVERENGVPEVEVADPIAQEQRPSSQNSDGPAEGKISETIRKMAQSPAILPGGDSAERGFAQAEPGESTRPTIADSAALCASGGLWSICAEDIMHSQVIWAGPDETVQQALAKMQQHDAGYIMVGQDGALEGIISKSDITGALSPYLRSLFAKWRRPLDDATLKIRVKWIMSRPVRTIKPKTPLAAIMENMSRFGGRALPVVDEQGKVRGLVTVFEIFQMLLKTCADISTAGKTFQAPPSA